MNNCYASIEMLYHPRLRGRPVAVGGSAEERHGIILARNYEARPYGIKVGQALWQAKQLCPSLIIVPPDYNKYLMFSRLFRKILADYSGLVEPFGLDESWVDITRSAGGRTGENVADEIRERVKTELGITVSVGVSFNKIFAKLGSDMKKPDATTVITQGNFRDTVWTLPAGDLLGVGRSTKARLLQCNIRTIGDIARLGAEQLQSRFGKWGLYLYAYAAGLDSSPVRELGDESIVKSVGNSTTCPRDLENEEDAHIVLLNLAESVAARMRELGLQAKTVQISMRRNDLSWFERQTGLERPTFIATELCGAAMALLRENYAWERPLRSIGIRGTNLVPMNSAVQLSIFDDEEKRVRAEKIEYAIDDIRRRFGHHAIDRALLTVDKKLGRLDAKSDNVIHPVGYL
jgi:DNA polymerase-4